MNDSRFLQPNLDMCPTPVTGDCDYGIVWVVLCASLVRQFTYQHDNCWHVCSLFLSFSWVMGYAGHEGPGVLGNIHNCKSKVSAEHPLWTLVLKWHGTSIKTVFLQGTYQKAVGLEVHRSPAASRAPLLSFHSVSCLNHGFGAIISAWWSVRFERRTLGLAMTLFDVTIETIYP